MEICGYLGMCITILAPYLLHAMSTYLCSCCLAFGILSETIITAMGIFAVYPRNIHCKVFRLKPGVRYSGPMASSRYEKAKRAFVTLLLSLARAYRVVVEVNRDSEDAVVHTAYRKVLLKVHPDKGGTDADAQRLQRAREEWKAPARNAEVVKKKGAGARS